MTNISLSVNEAASLLMGMGLGVASASEERFIGLGIVAFGMIVKVVLAVLEKNGVVVKAPPIG